jgi:hypothetical protein
MFPRLKRIASAYQRYRFTDLRFVVQPMCPSTTGGGWVAGVIPDPLDTNLGFDALQATLGAEVNKWWEAEEVHALSLPRDKLWTSEGDNARLYSPGRFVCLAVGTNTDLVNVSVVAHWKCELTVPSLEQLEGQTDFRNVVPLTSVGLNDKNYFPMPPYFGREVPKMGRIYQSSVPCGVTVTDGTEVQLVNYSYFSRSPLGDEMMFWGSVTWNDEGTGYLDWTDGLKCSQPDGQTEREIMPRGTVLTQIYPAPTPPDFRKGAAAL